MNEVKKIVLVRETDNPDIVYQAVEDIKIGDICMVVDE